MARDEALRTIRFNDGRQVADLELLATLQGHPSLNAYMRALAQDALEAHRDEIEAKRAKYEAAQAALADAQAALAALGK
jgi:hypothetical protein